MAQKNGKTDYLKVDPPVRVRTPKNEFQPTWACISFISPEDMIKERFLFEANRFLYHDVNKQIMDTTANIVTDINRAFENALEKKINSYTSSNSETYRAAADILKGVKKEVQLNEEDFITKVLRPCRIDEQELLDRFEVYKVCNNKELEADFDKENDHVTSVRGVKIRGVYEDLPDAQARCQFLRDEIEPAISVYTVPIGYWCPWDPNPDAVQDQDYMLPELNKLMGQYQRNVEHRNEFYNKRKQLMIDEANHSRNGNLRERLRQKVIQKQHQRIQNQMNGSNTNSNDSNQQQSQGTSKNNQSNRNRKKQKQQQTNFTKNDLEK